MLPTQPLLHGHACKGGWACSGKGGIFLCAEQNAMLTCKLTTI